MKSKSLKQGDKLFLGKAEGLNSILNHKFENGLFVRLEHDRTQHTLL